MSRWQAEPLLYALAAVAALAAITILSVLRSDAPEEVSVDGGGVGPSASMQAPPLVRPGQREGTAYAGSDSSATAGPVDVAAATLSSDGETAATPPLPKTLSVVVEPTSEPVTAGELYLALARSPWPQHLHSTYVKMSTGCEAPLDTDGDGRFDAADVAAEGDRSRALGSGQIRVDWHPRLARSLDLLDLREQLIGGYIVYLEAGGTWVPWSCVGAGG